MTDERNVQFIAARVLNIRASMPVETAQTTITSAPTFLARSMSGVMSGWVESILA